MCIRSPFTAYLMILASSLLLNTTDASAAKAVFTSTNDVDGNAVVMFKRSNNGTLSLVDEFDTGGTGTGTALSNQGAVVLTKNGHWLLVVNAGSDDISVFSVSNNGLEMTDIEPSGGTMPVSVTVHEDLVYVLNAGGDGNISGFTLDDGDLTPLDDSSRPLSGEPSPGPAQVGLSHDGSVLVVTERLTNRIDTYLVDEDGLLSDPIVQDSSGLTPFGFGFTPEGRLIVSEAFGGNSDASAVSSYDIEPDGDLDVNSASVPTTETAACWIVVTNGGKFAYTTNTGSDSITGYKVKKSSGILIMLNGDGVTATTEAGSAPTDMALSNGSRFLYALNSATGEIDAFKVKKNNGKLTEVDNIGGLPDSATGLAAR